MRKRFVVRKFIGREFAVVDLKTNSTVGVHPTKEAARAAADRLNRRLVNGDKERSRFERAVNKTDRQVADLERRAYGRAPVTRFEAID